jgi:F-box and WD-40 domain protein CDC4
VWSFSPPSELLDDVSMLPPKRRLEGPVPDRPLSAFSLDYRGSSSAGGDVDMPDAGPSTAPLQQSCATFFHDE